MSTFSSLAEAARASRRDCRGAQGAADAAHGEHDSLGGIMTNGYVTGPAGIIEGLCKELLTGSTSRGSSTTRRIRRLSTRSAANSRWRQCSCRPAAAFFTVCTPLTSSWTARISKACVCYSKSGRCEIRAASFIDASGDGDIAAAAGVPFDVGNAEYMGLNLAHTMGIRMANVNLAKYREANKQWSENNHDPKKWAGLRHDGQGCQTANCRIRFSRAGSFIRSPAHRTSART